MDQSRLASRDLKRKLKARKEQKFMMRDRLAKRDLDYAESGCAAPVTVEYRSNVRIETRGQAVVGAYAVNHYTHA